MFRFLLWNDTQRSNSLHLLLIKLVVVEEDKVADSGLGGVFCLLEVFDNAWDFVGDFGFLGELAG